MAGFANLEPGAIAPYARLRFARLFCNMREQKNKSWKGLPLIQPLMKEMRVLLSPLLRIINKVGSNSHCIGRIPQPFFSEDCAIRAG